MTGLTDEQRDELAKELLLSGFTEGTRRTVLDALTPLVARMVAEAKADALREAADEARYAPADSGKLAAWLRARANEIAGTP